MCITMACRSRSLNVRRRSSFPDGQFDNVVSYEQVLAEVGRLNRSKRAVLNTIAFMSEDAKAESALERMARNNGGTFRKVSAEDLKKRSPF